jgi:hypothetical protein
MDLVKRLGPGLGTGALVGAFWWVAYAPGAYPLLLFVGSHALAGVLLQGCTQAWIPRWRSTASTILGLVGGLLIGPLLVVMPFAWGWIAGLTGLMMIGAASSVGGLLGLEMGRHGLRGGLLVVALGIGLIWTNSASLLARDEPLHMAGKNRVENFPDQPVAIIGIDGADFQVMSPMIERGELPNLAELMANGRQGIFRSIEPTLSPVVWTTIFSGHPAEVHGLRSWSTSDNRNRRVPMIWDLFGAHDRDSLVINIPGTWPPAPVDNGRVLSGFPIPGIVSGGKGQLTGTVISSTSGEDGSVATVHAQSNSQGSFEFDVGIAAPLLRPRLVGVSHALIDAATQDRQIPVTNDRLTGTLKMGTAAVRLEAEQLEQGVDLPLDAWSEWVRFRVSDGFAYLRARVLDASSDQIRVYLTPAFQNPEEPRYPFTWNIQQALLDDLASPYIVEGVGWRAHLDERIAANLPTALADIERIHADAALALLDQQRPDLFAYAITVTDRIQHGFWRDHEPALYAPQFAPHEGTEGRDAVEDAYRMADSLLGEFVEALSADTQIWVISDHGAAPYLQKGEGGHRVEGIWIAAGPDIEPTEAFEELSILDLVPTLLHCIGAPAGEDMPGRVAATICPGTDTKARIASYRSETNLRQDPTVDSDVTIDATREAQLRSLGYIE